MTSTDDSTRDAPAAWPLVTQAMNVALRAHEGQVDKVDPDRRNGLKASHQARYLKALDFLLHGEPAGASDDA